MDREAFDNVVELHLACSQVLVLWPLIENKRKEFGFTDQLTDNDRLAENAWICTQMNKFIGKQKTQVYARIDDITNIIEYLKGLIDKNPVDASTRKMLIYCSLRNDWLTTFISYLVDIAKEGEDE